MVDNIIKKKNDEKYTICSLNSMPGILCNSKINFFSSKKMKGISLIICNVNDFWNLILVILVEFLFFPFW